MGLGSNLEFVLHELLKLLILRVMEPTKTAATVVGTPDQRTECAMSARKLNAPEQARMQRFTEGARSASEHPSKGLPQSAV